MTSRENRLAILVGGFIAVFAIGIVGYLFVWVPLSDKARQSEALEIENAEKDAKLRQIIKQNHSDCEHRVFFKIWSKAKKNPNYRMKVFLFFHKKIVRSTLTPYDF